MTDFRPSDADEAKKVIEWAAAEAQPLEIVAGGSKRALGRPARAAHVLDLARLSGIIDYDPSELVLTARAATPMAEIATQMSEQRQMFAFEPPDWRGLLGGSGEPTLGGTIACNLAGPRRVRAGAARDHFLGFAAINGWGDAWKSGGRVVKNVTGYDLCKLQAGAFGTLSVLTEISVRVMPRPEMSQSLLLHGLDDDGAMRAMSQALNTPHEVSAAAYLPGDAARRADLGDAGVAVLRLEGPEPSVKFRMQALQTLFGQGSVEDAPRSDALWRAIAAVSPLLYPAPNGAGEAAGCVWRICPTPASAATVLRAIRRRLPSAAGFYDWGGGLLWLRLTAGDAGPDAGQAVVREAVRAVGGHAMLVSAADTVRASVDVFEPLPGPLASLSQRVKANFDPQAILNPGRMQKDQ